MSMHKFLPLLALFIFCNSSLNAQDENVIYNDTLTKNLFQLKKTSVREYLNQLIIQFKYILEV